MCVRMNGTPTLVTHDGVKEGGVEEGSQEEGLVCDHPSPQ